MIKSVFVVLFSCFMMTFSGMPSVSVAFVQGTSFSGNKTAPSGIDWNTLCNDVSQMNILLQPCSDLTNSNGTLTSAGETTMLCISNGLSLGLDALHHGMSLSKVIFGLGLLAQPTGCGEFINMNSIETTSQFQFLIQAFNLH
jgi:hypothetical protein